MASRGGQKEKMDKSWSIGGCDWWLECRLAGERLESGSRRAKHGSDATSP